MNDRTNGSGSNTGLVIAIVALLVLVPCCGGLALLGAAFLGFKAVERPRQPETLVQPAPPQPPPVATPPIQLQPAPVIVPRESGGEETVPAAPADQ